MLLLASHGLLGRYADMFLFFNTCFRSRVCECLCL